ncbi:MAG TPA: type IX secretion system membrane protein PorP/SprF [Saprospiraceae bacterium]|nr:type IX secretion system membrane protein PorP/SprF [Saprospiraceae bacterium]
MRYFILPLFLAASMSLCAQQPAQYSLFMLNPMQWNPAYAGLDHSLSISAGYRKQWTQLPGSPAGQYIATHLPLYFIGGGLGLQVENDRLGAGRFSSAQLNYSFHRPLGNALLAIGLGAGITQRSLDGSLIRTPDGVYEPGSGPNHNDPLLPVGLESGMTPTFHAGVYFQSERFEAGLGLRHLTRPEVELPSFNFQLERSFFLQLGGHFDLGDKLSVHPALLVRSDMVETQTDVAALFRIQQNLLAGIGFRGYSNDTGDAVIGMAGFQLSENLLLAYAYDATVSGLRNANNGSHEIMLQYNLNRPLVQARLPRIIYNPRTL